MSRIQLLALAGLIVITPPTILALQDVGYVAVVTNQFTSWAGIQVFIDFVLMGLVAFALLLPDFRARKVPAIAVLIGMSLIGTPALLVYLLIRDRLFPRREAG